METSFINWQSPKSEILLNPRLLEADRKILERLSEQFQQTGHVWVTSSGSSQKANQSFKLIALSKKAFLESAKAVNAHLKVTAQDIWIQLLPLFHVGGLSLETRAHLSGSRVIDGLQNETWNPEYFIEKAEKEKATIVSFVPVQVFDLVTRELQSPTSLRACVVGGAKLDPHLYKEARKLGWALLPSYGMTECCSQIATATLESLRKPFYPELKLLSHIQAKVSSDGNLFIKSPSLLTGFAQKQDGQSEWTNPVEDGWYRTNDFVKLMGDYLAPLGRSEDYVKVNGEGVNLERLREILDEHTGRVILGAISSERSGSEIVLYHTASLEGNEAKVIQFIFNKKVAPYERITRVIQVDSIPRTALGKIDWLKLSQKG